MAASYRTDRTLPFPEPAAPAEGLDVTGLLPGDRVRVIKPLRDLKTVKTGAKGSVIWTGCDYRPVLQLEDGTVVNLIDGDALAEAPAKSARGTVSLLTLRHNTEGWKPGFENDVYLRIPAAGGLEASVRSIVSEHNGAQRGGGRDFKVTLETGAWDGPDLKPAAVKKIVTEALADWAA
ncbi:hypothetical protein [Arthrobacter sp. UYCo732]|uniref:hypothetical protein n=1 Tax=Arthrobacter sp. UYCo732 TaxID=3156336 RepID=UPI003398CA22